MRACFRSLVRSFYVRTHSWNSIGPQTAGARNEFTGFPSSPDARSRAHALASRAWPSARSCELSYETEMVGCNYCSRWLSRLRPRQRERIAAGRLTATFAATLMQIDDRPATGIASLLPLAFSCDPALSSSERVELDFSARETNCFSSPSRDLGLWSNYNFEKLEFRSV